MAPVIAACYHEAQLFGVTAVLASEFPFNAAGIQYSALLQRQMRFTALTVISIVFSMVGIAIAVGGAEAGYGYWALMAIPVASPVVASIGAWLTAGWVPGMPRRRAGEDGALDGKLKTAVRE